MKKYVLSLAVVSALLLVTTDVQAQSWKDLFNKDNIEKVVNAVTGNQTIDMTGTWTYSGSAIEFESDNLLQKAGGAAAAAVAEKKLDEQLAKVGIKDGQVSFTFNADSTFTSTVGKRTMTGTYSYDATDKVVSILRFCKEAKFRKEIFELLGVTYQFKNFKAFIEPLLQHDYLELTVPDKPTSPKQQYRTTKKGLLFLETV